MTTARRGLKKLGGGVDVEGGEGTNVRTAATVDARVGGLINVVGRATAVLQSSGLPACLPAGRNWIVAV